MELRDNMDLAIGFEKKKNSENTWIKKVVTWKLTDTKKNSDRPTILKQSLLSGYTKRVLLPI